MATTNNNKDKKEGKLGRRDVLKSLATVPVVGALAYGTWKKRQLEHVRSTRLAQELNLNFDAPVITNPKKSGGSKIRVGIIGFGIRGPQLLKAAGFIQPEQLQEWIDANQKNSADKRYEDFMNQDDLNIEIRGVCDVFDVYAERAISAASNVNRLGTGGIMGTPPKRYRTYTEMLAANDIDAVIIATPDHWHAKMAMDAARAGKHVYVEKGMTRTIDETFEMRKVIKETGIIFQLGHQGRQTESYIKAKEAIDKNILGPITLIQVNTNRNSPNGAWVYDINPEGSPGTIDWQQFLGSAPWHPFSLERFFRWRCWWDYGTGLSGDLLTHEYDAMNQILKLGIPDSVISSGGVYFYKDGRDVPDVYQVAQEYKDRSLTLLYSATLASDKDRGKTIMGHDGYMEVGENLFIYADPESTRFKDEIQRGTIDPSIPIYSYIPGRKNVDAISSATEKYFAGRGLLYTYRGGKRVDTTHLHVKEWIECIREGIQPSCDIDQGFEEAISSHMGTLSLMENRKIFWDKDKEQIV